MSDLAWPGSLTPFESRDYSDVIGCGVPYDASVYADFASYLGLPFPNPVASSERKFLRAPFHIASDRIERELLVQWVERKHTVRPSEAVICLHGNSALPDAWFSDSALSLQWGENYTNYTGTALYGAGFDVFAPFVTHQIKFQNARRRVAATFGERWQDMDVHRVVALFEYLKSLDYEKIHITGLSGGGGLTVLTARELAGDDNLGMALAIEGWFNMRRFPLTGGGDEAAAPQLYLQTWEMSFGPFMDPRDFYNLPPDTYVAHGTTYAWMFAQDYAKLTPRMVVTYTGSHEVKLSVWEAALARYRQDHGQPAPPPQLQNGVALSFSDLTDTSGHAFSSSGNVTISGGRARFNGNGQTDFISTPAHQTIALASANFAIEFEVEAAATANDATTGYTVASQRSGPSGNRAWSIYHYAGAWTFAWSADGSAFQEIYGAAQLVTGASYVLRFERSGNTLTISRNGQPIGTGAISGAIYGSTQPLRIGGDGSNAGGLNGWLDRFSLQFT